MSPPASGHKVSSSHAAQASEARLYIHNHLWSFNSNDNLLLKVNTIFLNDIQN